MHFISGLLFTADSVHLFVGWELLLRTRFKRHIAMTFEILHVGGPFPGVWVGPLRDSPREEGGDDKITFKKNGLEPAR